MRRWITRILTCLLLGAVINIAVAWTIALLPWLGQSVEIDAGSYELGISRIERPGTTTWKVSLRILNQSMKARATRFVVSDSVLQLVPNQLIPEFFEAGTRELVWDVQDGPDTITSHGWPWRSLYSIEPRSAGIIAMQRYFPTRIDLASFDSADMLPVPIQPLWLGFIANTVFYWAIFIGMIVSRTGVRRLWRFERGCCPRCNFYLRHQFDAGCSECGWRRDAVSNTINE